MTQGVPQIFTALLFIALLHSAGVYAQPGEATPGKMNATTDTTIAPTAGGPDKPVYYNGRDSTVYDLENGMVELFGNAIIKYGDLEVKAAYIRFSFDTYTLFAKGLPDSTGHIMGRPIFTDGDNSFEEDSAAYNFRSKRGISYGASTQEGDMYLHSLVSKRQENGWVHIRNGLFTTCNNPQPHYTFKLSRAIVVPGDKVVSGPLYMRVGQVPTPLALPFGFFPNKKTSTHGILLPGYGNGGQKGFFLQNLGYYVPLPPHIETKVLFDIYSRGSWNATSQTNYKKIYRYNGSFQLSRTVTLNGFRELPTFSRTTDFNIQWNHRQDAKARPGRQFMATVNAGTRNNFRNNLNVSQTDYLTNTLASAVQWSRTWNNANLSAQARHSQNTQSGQVDLTLPSLAFNRNRFDPVRIFNPSRRSPSPVGISYSNSFENQLTARDRLFRWDNAAGLTRQTRYGLRHQLGATAAFGKLVKVSPAVNYSQVWAMSGVQKVWDADLGALRTDTVQGFRAAQNWNASVTASTRLYGMANFRGSKLKAIRHVMSPSAGLSYTPKSDYLRQALLPDGSTIAYSPWETARYAPINSQKAGNVNLALGHVLEAKVRDPKQDKPTYKKISLIENASMRTSYNLMADSVNWSPVQFSAFTTILKNGKLNYSSSYSLYDHDSLGRTVNRFMAETQGKLMRMQFTTLALGFDLNHHLFSAHKKENPTRDEEKMALMGTAPDAYVDMNMPWNVHIDYNLRLNRNFNTALQTDELKTTQAVGFNGSITLFRKVALSANSGWDFERKEFAATMLGLSVDLHCWQLTGTWIPSGGRKSYMLQLNVKSPLLQDLKLQKRGFYGDDSKIWQ